MNRYNSFLSDNPKILQELEKVNLGFIALFIPKLDEIPDFNINLKHLHMIAMSVAGRFETQTIHTSVPELVGCVAVRKPSLLNTTCPSYAVVQSTRTYDAHSAGKFLRSQLFDILPEEDRPITLYEPPFEETEISLRCKSNDSSSFVASDINPIELYSNEVQQKISSIRLPKLFCRKEEKNKSRKPNISERKEISAIETERQKWLDALQQFTLEYVQRFREMPPMDEIEQRIRGMMLLPSQNIAELSRVKVNSDFRIFLPQYNELELRMTPLARTLYLFFLAHPEGVRLVDISDYTSELTMIYTLVKPGANENLACRSIESLVEPFSESLQQKLSMSRRSIRQQITIKEIADKYIITGTPGGIYRINLPTDLIDLPKILINS